MKKIAILGVGAFGFAILKYLDAKNDGSYALFAYDVVPDIMEHLRKSRKHKHFHSGMTLSNKVTFAESYQELVTDAEIIILSVRSDALRYVADNISGFLKKKAIVLNVAKALDQETGLPFSEILKRKFKRVRYAVFAGGTIASDLIGAEALGADVACKDKKALKELKGLLESKNLHIYTTRDVEGVEYASAFKNVISIMAGIIHSLGYSYGTETHIISRASYEVEMLVFKELHGKKSTFSMYSQCWGNDLWMSCVGNTRNRSFGFELGKGKKYDEAMKQMEKNKFSIEGVNTIRALAGILEKHKEKYPILYTVYAIVLKSESPSEAINRLISGKLWKQ